MLSAICFNFDQSKILSSGNKIPKKYVTIKSTTKVKDQTVCPAQINLHLHSL